MQLQAQPLYPAKHSKVKLTASLVKAGEIRSLVATKKARSQDLAFLLPSGVFAQRTVS